MKSLTIRQGMGLQDMFGSDVEWTALSDFVCLESFCLPDVDWIENGLIIELGRTSNLTELDIGSSQLKRLQQTTAGRKFLNLHERALRHPYDAAEQASRLSNAISHLTSLTRLVTCFPVNASLFGCLTRLVSLGIYVDADNAANLEHSLANLELLEELELASFPYIRSSCLLKLTRLKRLSLSCCKQMDDAFVSVLARLSQLTSLKVHHPHDVSPPFSYFSQFNRLSNLRQLHIASGSELISNPCDVFPEGSFPKLRVLGIGPGYFSDDKRRRIMERFPCLITLKSGYLRKEEAGL